MARTNATNFSGAVQFPKASAATDLFKKEDVQTLAEAVDQHDHAAGFGKVVNVAGLAAGAIDGSKLTDGTVTSAKIQDGTIATGDIADGAVTSAKLATAVNTTLATAQTNLLTNGGFEIWQRGGGPFTGSGVYTADRWNLQIAAPDTASISLGGAYDNATTATLAFSITHGAGNVYLQQQLKASEGNRTKGRPVSATLRVYSSLANSVRISLTSDGSGGTTQYSSFNQSVSTWETVSVTYTVPTDATYLTFFVNFGASCTGYVHNAMLVAGSVAADYAPLHPADEVARCFRYYEFMGTNNGGEIGTSGYAAAGGQAIRSWYQYKALKPVAPTVSKTGTWGGANLNQPSIAQVSILGFLIFGSSVAAGDAWIYNNAGQVIVEANP